MDEMVEMLQHFKVEAVVMVEWAEEYIYL